MPLILHNLPLPSRSEAPKCTNKPVYEINVPQRVPNDLLDVLGKVIAKSCLKMETNIGRKYRVAKYDKLLKRFHISSEDRGRQLLDHLGMRGFVIGYQWAGYGEGIHGWLDPDETRELYDFLDSLPLPRYEDTIEGLETFDRIPVEQRQIGFSFEEENLACVRTLAAIASNEQKGMLWGNDLLGYEED